MVTYAHSKPIVIGNVRETIFVCMEYNVDACEYFIKFATKTWVDALNWSMDDPNKKIVPTHYREKVDERKQE